MAPPAPIVTGKYDITNETLVVSIPATPNIFPVAHSISVTDIVAGIPSAPGSTIITVPAIAPPPPALLGGTSLWNTLINAPQNEISWQALAGLTYNIYRGGGKINGTPLPGSPYFDGGIAPLVPGQIYAYQVQAIGPAGPGALSSPINITAAANPNPPSGGGGTPTSSSSAIRFLPKGPLVNPGISQQSDGTGKTFLCPGPVGQKFTPTTPIDFMGGKMPLGVPAVAEYPPPLSWLTQMWRIHTPACDPTRTTVSCPGPKSGFILNFYDFLGSTYAGVFFTPNCMVDNSGPSGSPIGVMPFAVDITKYVLHATLLGPRSMIFNQGDRSWLTMYASDVNALIVDDKDIDGATLANLDYTVVRWGASDVGIRSARVGTVLGKAPAAGNITTWHTEIYNLVWFDTTTGQGVLNRGVIRGGDTNQDSYNPPLATDGAFMNNIPQGGNPNHRFDLWIGINSSGQQRTIVAEDGILQYDTGYLPQAKSITVPSGKMTLRFADIEYHTGLRTPDTNEVDTWTGIGIAAEAGFPATPAFPMIFA